MDDKNTHKEDSTTIHIKKTSYEGIHESLHEVFLLKGTNQISPVQHLRDGSLLLNFSILTLSDFQFIILSIRFYLKIMTIGP